MRVAYAIASGVRLLRPAVSEAITQTSIYLIQDGHEVARIYGSRSELHLARFFMMRWAIEQECSHALFVDDDMTYQKNDIAHLVKTIRSGDWAVVSAMNFSRGSPTKPAVSWDDPLGLMDSQKGLPIQSLKDYPVRRVQSFGLACCLMDVTRVRRALDSFYDPWDTKRMDQNPWLPAVFPERQLAIEFDMSFCYRLREGGAKLAVCADATTGHIDEHQNKLQTFLAEQQIYSTHKMGALLHPGRA